ncbi:MAG: hypothetical protein IMF07_00565 [Proteobacteria bacterium]|nr:hypothetical protein [Pseudomonadota bacterium]
MSTPKDKLLNGESLINRAVEVGVSLNELYDSNGVLDEPELQRRVLEAEKWLSDKGRHSWLMEIVGRFKNHPIIATILLIVTGIGFLIANFQNIEFIVSLFNDPIVISPSEIELKASPKELSGGWIPADITVKNSSKDDLYSVWVCFYLSEANLKPIDIAIVSESDKAHAEFKKLFNITRDYINPATGNTKLLLGWKQHEKHDFKRTAIYLEATVEGGKKRAYIGIQKLLPGESRLFHVIINYENQKQEKHLPIRLTSYKHQHSTWLHEQKQKAHLDFILPDARSIMEPMSLRLLDVGPIKTPQKVYLYR